MSRPVVINNMPAFTSQSRNVLGDALKDAARDGLINAVKSAPFKKGQLRSDSGITKVNQLKYRISFWKEYARFQEFGGDSKRTVRNYSTASTGAHFLRNAGDEQAQRISYKFKKHSGRI